MPTEPEATSAIPSFQEIVQRTARHHQTVGDMVYAAIKEGILTGAFAPGERLRQRDLAADLGVSRIPVRSALMQLEAEGLVELLPYRGALVRTLTVEQVREIYQLRTLLESYGLRQSAGRMTSARAERLLELGEALDAKPAGGEFVADRVAFYRELYAADENPLLVNMIEELRGYVGRYLLSLRVDHQHGGHRRLAELVAKGDIEAAEEHLRAHLEAVSKGLIGVLTGEVAEKARRRAADRT
ncbi:GntR family transcriptional regulator [Phytoactinopolyspora limicola]|uniref:GntR family transcriptional regulator n=1 Tax=Phytoactinopolyspora limicola TaxID=2715536 RepID=UPI00140A47FF|nr:GntR family transcriptional regulator [Phytoactinopolyspora limicola]